LLKLISIWSVFWVKVSIFRKVPTNFSKCVFLDYRVFDKWDLIYAKIAKDDTFLAEKWPKYFFSKNAAQRKIFFNIGQYFLVFCEKVVSIWSVFWEKVVSIVVSILTFFLQTTVVITGLGNFFNLSYIIKIADYVSYASSN